MSFLSPIDHTRKERHKFLISTRSYTILQASFTFVFTKDSSFVSSVSIQLFILYWTVQMITISRSSSSQFDLSGCLSTKRQVMKIEKHLYLMPQLLQLLYVIKPSRHSFELYLCLKKFTKVHHNIQRYRIHSRYIRILRTYPRSV